MVEAAGDAGRRSAFDVFLSHNSADKAVVADLAGALRGEGLLPWLDVEQVVPGERFQAELAAGLRSSGCLAVFVGARGVGGWVMEEVDVAVARSVAEGGFRVFLVLLEGAPEPFDATGLHAFLSQRSWVDLRRVDDRDQAVGMLARAVRGEPLGLVDRSTPEQLVSGCPFVGLREFRAEDAGWFFGRDADIQRMGERLRTSRFLAVLGRSGVGKTSLVRAGLVPALAAGQLIEGSQGWPVRMLRPTEAPLEALASHVSELRPDLSVTRILEDLAGGELALKLLTGARDAAVPVVWVVDQAEELFTLNEDPSAAHAFMANLLHASQDNGPAVVVVCCRSDFYGQFSELPAFGDRISQNQHVVTDLTVEQLGQVMLEPASLAGLSFEPGLMRRITEDVAPEAGGLPLLQHALFELCERRQGRQLTHAAYDEIGGVAGALARHADAAFEKLERTGDGEAVRRLMLELVRLGEGVEDTKQPVQLSELVAPAYPLRRLHTVAAALADARLVTTNSRPLSAGAETVVELAHEALITRWPRLRLWLDDNRDEIRTRRRISVAARDWDTAGRPDGRLYRDTDVPVARSQLVDYRDHLASVDHDFLAASIAFDEHLRRQARLRRTALQVLTTVAVVAALVATRLFISADAAEQSARAAEQQARDNATSALAQQARALAADEPALALAVAAEALHRNSTKETADTLQVAYLAYSIDRVHSPGILTGHTAPVVDVAFNPDGRQLATASADGTAKVWDTGTSEATATLTGHTDAVYDVEFSPDGHQLATASADGTARLWDAETGEATATLTDHDDAVDRVVYSPDGHLLATASADGTAKLWDAATGQETATVAGQTDFETDVVFSPDGRRLAVTSDGGTAKLWDTATAQETATLDGHTGFVSDVVFSPDGHQLATASDDGTTKLWDTASTKEAATLATRLVTELVFSPNSDQLATAGYDGAVKLWSTSTGKATATLTGHTDIVPQVVYSPDGHQLATAGGGDGAVKLWDTGTGKEAATLTGHTDFVSEVGFSPDGHQLATAGGGDGMAMLWDATATGKQAVTLAGHTGVIADVLFGSKGDQLATAAEDGTARLWDTATGEETATLTGHTGVISELVFSPDGHLLATASGDGTARLWDTATGKEVAPLTGHADFVYAVAFSPDGQQLATASADSTARLWDTATGKEVATLTGHSDFVTDVAFSPGGHQLATASDDGTAKLWDTSTGKATATLSGHADTVNQVAYRPNGHQLATASSDGTAKLWDTSTGKATATLTDPSHTVTQVVFSPNGHRLATVGSGRTVRLWDTATGRRTATLAGHTGAVVEVAFRPDGHQLATASEDGTAKLWDAVTGKEAATLTGLTGAVFDVAFSPDGQQLATSGADRTALVRHLVLSPEQACSLIRSQVTSSELVAALGGDRPQACTHLPSQPPQQTLEP